MLNLIYNPVPKTPLTMGEHDDDNDDSSSSSLSMSELFFKFSEKKT